MKKEADRRGAELAPTSLTAGMLSGRGVVSMSIDWLNLVNRSISKISLAGPRTVDVNCGRWMRRKGAWTNN